MSVLVDRYKDLRRRMNLVWGDQDAREILLGRMDELWEQMTPEERDQINTRPVPYTPPPLEPEE